MSRWRLLLATLALLWFVPALAQDGSADEVEGDGSAVESTQTDDDAGAAGGEADGETEDPATEKGPEDDDDAVDGDGQDGDGAAAEEADEDAGDAAAGAEATDMERPWTFGAYDSDGDGSLTQGEFGTGLFQLLVGEGEGLSQEQYEQAATLFGVEDAPDFQSADVNQDGVVTDDQEFVPALAMTVFEQWDADDDSMLTAQEYGENIFAALDADGDGAVDGQELEPIAAGAGEDTQEVAGGGAAGLTAEDFMETTAPEAAPAGDADVGDDAVDGADDPATDDDAVDGNGADDAAGDNAADDDAADDDAMDGSAPDDDTAEEDETENQ